MTSPMNRAPSAADIPARQRRDASSLQLPRDEVEAVVHDLRNSLNTVLLSAGIVAASCRDQPQLARFISQFEQAGERCAELLQRFSDRHL